MAGRPIVVNLDALIAQVDRSIGIKASAKTLIEGIAGQITTAVTTALEADDAADQGTVDSVNAAIASVVAAAQQSDDELAAAVANHSTPPVPPNPEEPPPPPPPPSE